MIRNFIVIFSILAALIFVFCVFIVLPLIALNMWQCADYDTATKRTTKYSAGVCYI